MTGAWTQADVVAGADALLASTVMPRHVGGVYDILNWMTGESLMTHQLPRASRECEGNLRAQHPDLAEVVFPEGEHTKDTVAAWLAGVVAEHGETREVAPLPADDHTSIDPVTELRMMRPDAEIIEVNIPRDPS